MNKAPPKVKINFVPAKIGEIIKLGPLTIRVMEDGSRTDNRLSAIEIILPPKTPGPPPHWHEMHDETFLVTRGKARFFSPAATVDAEVGDYVVVPVGAPHTFENPFAEEARIFNTFTPAFYINYFKLLAQMIQEASGETMTQEAVLKAMGVYATLPFIMEEAQGATGGGDKV